MRERCVSGALGGQNRRVTDGCEPPLGAGNWTWVSVRVASALYCELPLQDNLLIFKVGLSVVAQSCDPSTSQAEAGPLMLNFMGLQLGYTVNPCPKNQIKPTNQPSRQCPPW